MESLFEVLGALVAVAVGTLVIDWIAKSGASPIFAGSFAPNTSGGSAASTPAASGTATVAIS